MNEKYQEILLADSIKLQKNFGLSGTNGWLLVLIFLLLIMTPWAILNKTILTFETAENGNPNLIANTLWIQYKQLIWIVNTATLALTISAGYRLWRIHTNESVRFAIIAMWLAGPVSDLAYAIVNTMTFGVSAATERLPQIIISLIRSCFAPAVWTAYLKYSARVKNTYLKYSWK